MIKMTNVQFQRENRSILTQIDLQMNDGEHWVLLGRNGSGKTTLLEMMTGYVFPSSGKVEVLGNVYGSCDVREVRKKIGYISQSLFEKMTLSDPVWEAVAGGELGYLRFYQVIPERLVDKAMDTLKLVRMDHVANQSLGSLSQGERKKVMLARALMSNPHILILDEPCSGLDLYEREQMLKTIGHIGESVKQIIYVTHQFEEIISMFSHVALIGQGTVLRSGRKEDVLTHQNIQEAYGVPVAIDWDYGRPWIKVKPN